MRAWLGALAVAVAVAMSQGCREPDHASDPKRDVGATAGAASAGVGGLSALPEDGDVAAAKPLHKLDLLLMLDNSADMLDKQRLLADAVSWLLSDARLPVDDIHVGVVTSSLGSHGANGKTDVCTQPSDDDHAHLLGSLRGLKTPGGLGFLAWGPEAEGDMGVVVAALQEMVGAAGDEGCGYEASLEAWYRFLIDPAPPSGVAVPPGSSLAVPTGIDETVLAQREAFLRPDSVLAIVVLSDENDCSIRDDEYGWLVSRDAAMVRATSACANPNDPCCRSCGDLTPHPGCPPTASDPACANLTQSGGDEKNLRCFDQKRRFGFDLLLPLERYRDGLTRQMVFDRKGMVVPNPLFVAGQRHPSQVIYTGIVGVPWQDLADAASLSGPSLTYLTAAQLSEQGRWEALVGDPEASPPKRPGDPFMIETPDDRSSLSAPLTNPFVEAPIVSAASLDPAANPINGHESVNVGNRRLQTACAFPLSMPRVCDEQTRAARRSCRCYTSELPSNDPACQPPGGGAPDTTQRLDHAYPGTRHLLLQRALGNNAVTASICPKVVTPDSADYGYRPAMRALATRLEAALEP